MRRLSLAVLLVLASAGCAMQAGDPAESEAVESSDEELASTGVIQVLPRLRANLVAVAEDGTVPTSSQGWKLCDMDDEGFVIRVKNQGPVGAPASITLISGGRGVVALPTPPIAAGATVELHADFWEFATCTPDCGFTIKVDAGSQVIESDESNAFGGWCIG